MHAEQANNWMENIFAPQAEFGSVLLLDSWTGFKQCMNMEIVAQNDYDIRVIPKGTTAVLQPCDVFFNRQLKQFLRFDFFRERFLSISTNSGVSLKFPFFSKAFSLGLLAIKFGGATRISFYRYEPIFLN